MRLVRLLINKKVIKEKSLKVSEENMNISELFGGPNFSIRLQSGSEA